jgi:membrane-bound serine protease (ClpP class)
MLATAWLRRTAVALAVMVIGTSGSPSASADPEAPVHVVELRGIIHPLSAGYLIEAIDRADSEGAALLVVEVDTPGGLVESTKGIAQRMLKARTPIAVYVSPSGARAASAGFLLLIAADVAAMAPATNTGAAHPVDASGSTSPDDIGMKKAESDIAAFARTIAQNRNRNVELAEKAVTESVSFTETEALEEGLIDLIAADRSVLLEELDGRPIQRFDGSETVLETGGVVEKPLAKSFVQKFLGPMLSPEIVLLLLGIGMLGIYIELSHPGLILPGVVGVLCLLLFALAFQFLPVNIVGLLLVALGLVLFILEIKVVSYGMLTVGGIACLLTGLLIIFPRDIPALKVPFGFVVPLALALGGTMAIIVTLMARAQASRVVTGREGIVGEVGVASTDLKPLGKVFVHGELWDAEAVGEIASGEEIRVCGIEGMKLLVERVRRD